MLSEQKPYRCTGFNLYTKNSIFNNMECLYQIQDFDMFISDLEKGRGVVIYVKKYLCADSYNIESQLQESVWCSIKLRNQDYLLIGCLYRNLNSSEDNFNNMLRMFDQVKTERFSHKLLLGNFNLREIN